LAFDTSNMKVTVALDRQVYLPGEMAEITLTISNLSGRSVVGLTPFLSTTSCLGVAVKDGRPPNFEGDCGSVPIDSSNTTTFQAGETKQVVLKSYDPFTEIFHSAMRGGSVVTHPGNFVLVFQYGSSTSQVDFKIAPAILEADEVVRLRDGIQHFETLAPRPFPDYAHVLALRSESLTYACSKPRVGVRSGLSAQPRFHRNSHSTIRASRSTPRRLFGALRPARCRFSGCPRPPM
jgi:hypothetical protein